MIMTFTKQQISEKLKVFITNTLKVKFKSNDFHEDLFALSNKFKTPYVA